MEAYIVLGIVAAAIWWVNREARIAFGPGRGIPLNWSIPSDGIEDPGRHDDNLLSYDDGFSSGSETNPATGLPMVGGTDTAGNPFGCDNSIGSFDSFGISDSFGSSSSFDNF